MPILQAHNISYLFDDGEVLFQQLSCSMTKRRVGLVGQNGVGKSILASILHGCSAPSSGTVIRPQKLAWYRQQSSPLSHEKISVAQFLGKHEALNALKLIEQGDSSEYLFELVEEQWDLSARLTKQLIAAGLPANPNIACSRLSGGQMARLQLWKLFESDVELLILDEPSNHLDTTTKQWLMESMDSFNGAILIVSHDRQLLREVEEIWELSELGLTSYGGNYDLYAQQKQAERDSVERQLNGIYKQQKQLQRVAQRNKEKAQQRAAQGSKLRKDGSQPKVLLDAKKDKATARASNRNKNTQLRQTLLTEKQSSLEARMTHVKHTKLTMTDGEVSSRQVISMLDGMLQFGTEQRISLQICARDKVHLSGPNGSGKSTLLKTLLGQIDLRQGTLQINTPLYYLDQHFCTINPEFTLLDNLMVHCEGMQEKDARTLLAGIGFRRDSVFRYANMLSGGEMMKLAMIIVAYQADQPFLLLDEPDNHLDLDSKIVLAEALKNYRGGFVLISHDKDFAEESGIDRKISL